MLYTTDGIMPPCLKEIATQNTKTLSVFTIKTINKKLTDHTGQTHLNFAFRAFTYWARKTSDKEMNKPHTGLPVKSLQMAKFVWLVL